jgi:hypothetical protein
VKAYVLTKSGQPKYVCALIRISFQPLKSPFLLDGWGGIFVDKLVIKAEVQVIIVVTEQFKHKLIFELQEKVRKVELEVQQLEFTSRRTLLEADRQGQLPQVQRQLEAERAKREEVKLQFLERIKLYARLQPGDEIIQGNVESLVDLRVGDTWSEVSAPKIVIKDDQVVEIRRG